MSAEPSMRVWWFLLMLVAVEVGLFAALFAVIQRRIASAVWRRTWAQAAIVGVLLIALFELSGAGREVAGWAANAVGKKRGADSATHSGLGGGSAKAAIDDPRAANTTVDSSEAANGLQLKASFRSEVEARLAQSQGKVPGTILAPAGTGAKAVSEARPASGLAPVRSDRLGPIQTGTIAASDSISVLWVCLAWVSGAGLVAARAFLGRCLFVCFRFRRRRVTEAEVLQRVNSLAKKIGLARRVRAIESARLTSPIAFGILHPAIGLPLGFGKRFSPGQQEAMLAHELAHLAAHDPFWSLMADAASALLWWHPAVWWLRRQLQLSSEMAADEASLVVAQGPGLLAECLVEIGAAMTRTPLLGQLHMAGFHSCLGRRVQRLVHLEGRNWSPPRRLPSALVRSFGPLAFAVVVILCTGWVIPRSLTKGETMKSIQLNWKHSLATFALLASVNTGGAATDVEAQRGADALHAKIIPVKNAVPSAEAAEVQPTLKNKRSRVEADDRTQQVVVPATDQELKEVERTIARLDTPRQVSAGGASTIPGPVPPPPPEKGEWTSGAPPPPGAAQEENAFRRRYGIESGSGPVSTAAAPAGRRRMPGVPGMSNRSGQLESKLREIVLEEASFDNLPLAEVLKILRDESRKHDGEKKGINFLINPNTPAAAPTAAGGVPIDPATGLPMAVAAMEVVDLSGVTIKFNMPLRDVTMKDLLDAIVKVADKPIEYALEDYAVVFSLRTDFVAQPPLAAAHPPLSVRTFKVDTNTFVAGLESAFGIKIESSNGGAGARSRKIQAALKELLTQLGVSMDGSKAVFYNELTGIVMARATYDDLDVFHAAIATLGGENTEPSRGFGDAPGRFNGPRN